VLDPTGQIVVELPANQSWPECLTWSADGELLALAAGRKLQVYTFQGESVLQTDGHPSTITAIGWSARGDALAISCYGGLACSEPDCPPVETVVAVLQEKQVPLQEKTHCAVLDLKRAEVEQLCERLGKKLAASTGQPDRTGRR
jgi:hypothetical protein